MTRTVATVSSRTRERRRSAISHRAGVRWPAAIAVIAVIAVFAAILCVVAGAWWLAGRAAAQHLVEVVDVVDGDTIVVLRADGTAETVRLLGVDTPETVHPDRPVECFGPQATAFTRAALLGRRVWLEVDSERRDRYGRMLAYVTVRGVRFNDRLLSEGYARLLVIPPNVRHGRALLAAESQARRAGRGLWSACA